MAASTLTAPMFDVWEAAGWSKSEAIPARRVLICWKHEIGRGVVDVLVTPFPDDRQYFHDYWDGTSGACYSDWLQSGKNTMTPENVFGELAASIGFASKEAAEKAIVMFSRIEECAWARAMLASDSYDRLRDANLTALVASACPSSLNRVAVRLLHNLTARARAAFGDLIIVTGHRSNT